MPVKKIIETIKENCNNCRCQPVHHHNGGCGVYGLGLLGAAFYYFPHVANFNDGVVAFVKILLWPAMLVYQALSLLQM